jgi:4-diphosphocytidyl-2-C-methyl-D-erythritol kinase
MRDTQDSCKDAWDGVWPAPAKLNLFLHVVGRRADGYHLLQTLFRFIDHGDLLRFSPRDDREIVLALHGQTQGLVVPQQNLSVRAARRLLAEAGCRRGVTIHLAKRLPVGAGLGGGSSDAATTLLVLNHLWKLGFSRAHLARIGLELGADVPVFVLGQNAFAEGVGEILTPVRLPAAWYLVLTPPVAVPTPAIFRARDLRRDTPRMRLADWRPGMGGNDLEAVAARLYPPVAEHLAWLRARVGPAKSRMSGSGACVFAECETHQEAARLLAEIPHGWQGWIAQGQDAHPLAAL